MLHSVNQKQQTLLMTRMTPRPRAPHDQAQHQHSTLHAVYKRSIAY